MSTWTTSIDLSITCMIIMLAFAYIVKRLSSPEACQAKPRKKPEVIVGNNLAKGLALAQKKQFQHNN